MAEPMEKTDKRGLSSSVSSEVDRYVSGLSEEQVMLVVLKSQLYEGSWDHMLEDLRNRLSGKPYIFKLANRIQDDIDRIEDLNFFEKEFGIDLADYVEMP